MTLRVVRFLSWWRGLPENPFVVCQHQAESRQRFLRRMWSSYGLYSLLLALPLLLAISTSRNLGIAAGSQTVQGTVVLLAFLQILYVAMRSVTQTACSVVQERQRGTLLTLALTQVNSADYADGIVMAGVRPVIREITVMLPLSSIIGWYAGADAFSLFMLWSISVLMSVFFGYLGVWISAGSKDVGQATHRAATQTLFLLLVSPFLLVFAGFWAFPLWIVHPFVALSLAIWGAPDLQAAGSGALNWMMVRWWALLALPIYLFAVRSFRRRAVTALERTHLI